MTATQSQVDALSASLADVLSQSGITTAVPLGPAAQNVTTDGVPKIGEGKSDASKTQDSRAAKSVITGSSSNTAQTASTAINASQTTSPTPSNGTANQPNTMAGDPAAPKLAQNADSAVASLAVTAAQTPTGAQATTSSPAALNVQISTQTPPPDLPALAVAISAKSLSGAKQFDIRLDPPELGRVEVRLSIDNTGKVSAHLSADQPDTLDVLQKDAPALTRALRDAGLDVSQNGLNFSLRQQSGDGRMQSGRTRSGNSRSFTVTAANNLDTASAAGAYSMTTDSRLDIRV